MPKKLEYEYRRFAGLYHVSQSHSCTLSAGELYDIIPSFAPGRSHAMDSMGGKELYAHLATSGRCSGLIKVTRALPTAHPSLSISFLPYVCMSTSAPADACALHVYGRLLMPVHVCTHMCVGWPTTSACACMHAFVCPWACVMQSSSSVILSGRRPPVLMLVR